MNEMNVRVLNWVVGYPIEHSMSPQLHTTLYKNLGINASLEARSYTDPERLVIDIKENNIPLTAVTMPLKRTVINYLDQLDKTAKKLGAVNTIIQSNGQLIGYNTDIEGIRYSLKPINLDKQSVLILGAGAVAHMMGLYLSQYTNNLYWYNRSLESAYEASHTYGGKVVSLADMSVLSVDLIINTTPVGMVSQPGIPIDEALIHKNQTVFDVIYKPLKTPLILAAEKKGALAIPGLDMFVVQAIKQIELWQQKPLLTEALLQLAKTIVIEE